MSSTSGALEAIDRLLNRGGDADDVLRQVVATLHERAGAWYSIVFARITSSCSFSRVTSMSRWRWYSTRALSK